ncbi:polyketide synthase [Fusarium subglutinans]|uniref:Polyketide synthase n=1 Tax=Gibberella subglutinans TaxID=42677 RepID=A0A8H5PZW7_GIBSU|nr:polyketide synthase [Fusarium subglutinans]KAF5606225.1 polyketide synthase [Fusarium subglutinans]
MSDIAIIGYSFKLPQDVEDDDAFWDVLQNRRNLMTGWPESRVKTDSFSNNKHQKWNGKGGHFLSDDVAAFDAPFFSLTAKEASAMDPMQRWTLESTYHAFENAGLPVDSLKGSRTAVFSASMLEDYSRMTAVDPDNLERTAVTGSTVSCIIPNRVSCLSAVDMACKALKSGDASCAVVTGANLLLDPSIFQVLANQGFLSPDGVCYSFDERANGYARGEGVIAVVLKPVQAAIENGDMIRAVIRSIGSNQDGHTPILTQPSSQSQEELIRHVYKKAGLPMSDTRYVEAHGTGTPVGDPIEVKAIGRCFQEHRSHSEPLYVGSVKANIGHLEGASALASLVKCICNMTRHLIHVPTQMVKWPVQGLRRVSLNSFGFGGSNSHIVLDDALHYLQDRSLSGIHNTSLFPRPVTNGSGVTNGHGAAHINGANGTNGAVNGYSDVELHKLLVWTTADEKAAKRTLEAYDNFHKETMSGDHKKLDSLAFTLGSRRSNMLWRAFSVVDGSEKKAVSPSKPIRSSEDLGLAFVFTGQGAQSINMGSGLEHYAVYRETLEKISEIYSSFGCSWNLFGNCGDNINMPQYSQPLATAVQIALVDLLASFRITPKIVVGHSSGEIAAAYASGVLSLESACRVSYFRGVLAGKLRETNASTPGAMLSINLAPHHVSEYLEKTGVLAINVACINSPLNVTLSGPEEAIDKIKSQADQDGIFAQKLKTGVAYHSPSMKAIASEYLAALEGLTKRKDGTSIPMVSSVTGKSISPETLSTGQYWVYNMLSPVRFAEAVQAIANKNSARKLGLGNITDLIEIGPHPALRRPVKETLDEMSSAAKGVRYSYVLHRFHPAIQTTLELAGQLFCQGYPVSVSAVNQQRTKAKFLVNCPKYPFDRSQRYWAESRLSRDFRLREAVKGELLGVRVSDWNPLEPRWRNFWSIDSSAWTGDHKISDTVLFPASGMLLMAIEAAQDVVPSDRAVFGYNIEKAEFMNPIIVPGTWEDRLETQVCLRVVDKQLATKYYVSIFTYSHNEWVECFTANISVEFQDNDSNGERRVSHEHIRRQCQECTLPIDSGVFYHDAAAVGLQYGDWFRLMRSIKWDGKTSAVARVDLSQSRFNIRSLVHPTVLDQAFQVLRASSGQQTAANVPVKLENAWFSSKAWKTPTIQWISEATPTVHGYGEQGKVTALGEDGEVLCCIERAVTSAVSGGITQKEKKLMYSVEWKPQFSMLGSSQLTRLCAANAVPKDDSTVLENHSRLCHTLELVAARVLKNVDKSRIPVYLQRHVEWMGHHVGKLSAEHQAEATNISDEELESRLAEVDSVLPAWKLYTTCARKLPEILSGELDPLQVVFESDQADIFYSDLFRNLCADGQLNYLLDLASHENPALRVLEVGAGTGGMTGHVISALQEREMRTGGLAFSEYTYTDISPAFFETASQRWPDLKSQGRITFKTLDLDRRIDSQGFDPGSYDLVIAASVLHATPYLEATIRNVRKALKPGGRLILLEVINPNDIATNFMAGLVPGWWVAREEWRPHSAAIPEHLWDKCLKDNGFSGNDLVIRDYQDNQCHIMSVIVTTASEPEPKSEEMVGKGRLVMLISDDASTKERELADQVRARIDPNLERRATVITFSLTPVQRELAKLTAEDAFICFAEAGDKPLLSTLSEGQFSCLQFLISRASNLLWVTSASISDSMCPDYSVAQGFFRSIRAEQPDTHIVTLAIDGEMAQASQACFISEVYEATFETETPSNEVEYVVRDGVITTGRAVRDFSTDTALRSLVSKQLQQKPWGEGPGLKLDISQPGSLDSLQFVEDQSLAEELGPYDVEIEARAWGFTSRDLDIALGHPDRRIEEFGSDCVGFVARIGESCSTIRIGDRVAMVSNGCMRKYARANEAHVFKIPDSLSIEDAAQLASPGLAACHSILNVARVQENNKVLIHSAASILGQIAVRLAQTMSARVFATVSTAAEKQLLVDTIGLNTDSIFDSNSPSLTQDVMRVTEEEGVDVLLDCSRDTRYTPLSCVTDGGCIVSLGGRNSSMASTMAAEIMSRNLTFSSIDIMRLKPKVFSQLAQTTLQLLAEVKIPPPQLLPAFKISDIKNSFKKLQEDTNDRVVVTAAEEDAVPQFVQDRRQWTFDGNSTYLVAGGSGGLGRAIIRWMADRGAKHLIVPSRSGATSEAAAHLVAQLTSQGVNIAAPMCDVSIREDVTVMLEECSRTMPPIKGCINAAMVLQDAIFQSNMTFQQWELTIRSKVDTSKNLHELLPKDLDFFILLSSLAGVVGQMASANYAGGCAYQDALAKHRRMNGQSALSLNIGWMSNIGIIAEKEAYQRQRQTSNDMQPIEDKELLALLTLCCDPNNPLDLPPLSEGQVLFGLRTPADILSEGHQPPALLERPLLSAFSFLAGNNNTPDQAGDHAENARDTFQGSSDARERQQVVIRAIAAKLARAMSISPDDVEPSKPLSSYGVDSLMAVELRNWINKEFSSTVAVFDIIGSTSIAGVAEVIETRSSI